MAKYELTVVENYMSKWGYLDELKKLISNNSIDVEYIKSVHTAYGTEKLEKEIAQEFREVI